MLCQVDPENYENQLLEKNIKLQTLIPDLVNLSIFKSLPQHYRMRAEFRIWHEGTESDYIMFDQATKNKVKIKYCPMAHQLIADLMPVLMQKIKDNPVLRLKLFQIEFLASLSGQVLVSLIYRRSIEEDENWLHQAQILKNECNITHIIGRARKQKIMLDNDYIIEKLNVDNRILTYQQVENSFTQPNALMAQNMLNWARKVAQLSESSDSDLIELYCGNGHFSIALADCYRKVLATEISKNSVKSANYNIKANNINNLTVVKLSAEEISLALQGQTFRRLKDINLQDYNFQTIFVDPPRSGLDDITRQMVCKFEYIIYISCNPETLQTDLQTILTSHELIESALFDQFPYTKHIETGVFLKKKPIL